MNEFSLDELQIIAMALHQASFKSDEKEETRYHLANRVDEKIAQLEELASMDFDDCAGGACKL